MVIMKILLLIALLFMVVFANAQSPFKPEPKVVVPNNYYMHVTVAQPDSFVNVFRFTGNVAAYNYTFGSGGGSSNLSGAEYGWERQRFNYTTNAWDVLYSINVAWFPINTSAPVSLANMQTFGATFGFKNPIPVGNSVIQIGPDFNPHAPKSQQFGVLATIGILFN